MRDQLIEILKDFAKGSIVYLYRHRCGCNVGDALIYASTIELLREARVEYREADFTNPVISESKIAVVGGGALNWLYQEEQLLMKHVNGRNEWLFMPCSIEGCVEFIQRIIQSPHLIISREHFTLNYLNKKGANVVDGEDTAFFYSKYSPKKGEGTLQVYRRDVERSGRFQPSINDIAITSDGIKDFLQIINKYASVTTDRLHVAIAATMLGKQVTIRPGRLNKQCGIWERSLRYRGAIWEG